MGFHEDRYTEDDGGSGVFQKEPEERKSEVDDVDDDILAPLVRKLDNYRVAKGNVDGYYIEVMVGKEAGSDGDGASVKVAASTSEELPSDEPVALNLENKAVFVDEEEAESKFEMVVESYGLEEVGFGFRHEG
jgi:hypothetical protein